MSTPLPEIISWPLGGIRDGRLQHAREVQSIEEVFLNILLTRPGERLMRPEFGAGLADFIHQPNNETTRHLMAELTRKSIERWEPRAVVERVTAEPVRSDPSLVQLTVHFRMRHDPAPLQFSLAFNLEQLA